MKNHFPTKQRLLLAENLRFAKKFFPNRTPVVVEQLRAITLSFSFSLKFGDLLLLSSGWYITHAGLIRLAKRCHCSGMHSQPVRQLSDPSASRYAFRATVYKSSSCRGFVGYGDADPSNVSPLVRGAEMRVAETRAVNRALRKAYGIGICSVEEIGSLSEPAPSSRESKKLPPQPANGNYGGPKVRDRLCQIIRQHQLDPTLVKAYATDSVGPRRYGKPPANRSKTLSRIWPTGPRKTAMPCFAS